MSAKKTLLWGGVAAVTLLAVAGAAKAADDAKGDDEDGGGGGDGGGGEVPGGDIIFIPNDTEDDNGFDDPLKPIDVKVCNFSGCGPAFDKNHETPAYYALRIQQLGYPINAAGIAANGSFIAVNPQRQWVREFQRDSNAVRAADSYDPITEAGKLDEDGLVGNMTIAAINRAHQAVQVLGLPWLDIVELA
jgi:hypothetical protein